LIDYHMHTYYSDDGKMTLDQACKAAIDNGLLEIAITDHMEIDWPYRDMPFEIKDIDSYIKEISQCRQKYAGQLSVKTGVELGMQHTTLEKSTAFINKYPFDFVIASFHIVDGCDPYYPEYYETRTKKESYIDYYRTIYDILPKYSDYNVLGHLDLVKRYSPYEYEEDDHKIGLDIIEAILKTVIDQGKGIELNSSGFAHKSQVPMPHPEIIKLYKDLGGEIITIGSDSHKAESVAYKNKASIDLLKGLGFKYITCFDRMEPVFIRI
jgi:histidinol-phosphatase (PHP family)